MRNYKNESKWKRNKYDEIRAHIEKELGAELRKKLKANDETIAGWIRQQAIDYIERK